MIPGDARGASPLTVDRDKLAALAADAWGLFDESQEAAPAVVVDPSMPILYFGDTVAYGRAPLKVITVGLNPSLNEFPRGCSWKRFPRAAPDGSRSAPERYLESLDEYFHEDVWGWFARGFGPILHGLRTSYGSGAAIHTDIASPVATAPLWSGLRKLGVRLPSGAPLWRRLADLLAPDVVIISVAREHLKNLGEIEWRLFHRVEREHPFDVLRGEAEIGDREVPVFFGRCVNVPFGSISHLEKERLGVKIKASL